MIQILKKHEKYKLAPAMRRQIADITDEEGLKRAYASKNGLRISTLQ